MFPEATRASSVEEDDLKTPSVRNLVLLEEELMCSATQGYKPRIFNFAAHPCSDTNTTASLQLPLPGKYHIVSSLFAPLPASHWGRPYGEHSCSTPPAWWWGWWWCPPGGDGDLLVLTAIGVVLQGLKRSQTRPVTTCRLVFKAGVLHASINCLIANDFAWWSRDGEGKRSHCYVHVHGKSELSEEMQAGGRGGKSKDG